MTLRVAINARLSPSGTSGGVTQFVIGLVHGLSQLTDGDEEYVILTSAVDPDWLRPWMGENMSVAHPPLKNWREKIRHRLGPAREPLERFLERIRHQKRSWSLQAVVPQSDGFIESLGVDMIHFPTQQYTRCDLPSIYNPHDLQHLHFPEFFSPEVCRAREVVYRAGCDEAVVVAPEAEWVKDDIVSQYGVAPEKIRVVHAGATTEAYGELSRDALTATRKKFDLPESFLFYPAQTFPHKNHERLFEALVLLRDDEGLRLPLVCTGRKNDYWPALEQAIKSRRLEGQVRFLGYVSSAEVRSLYRLAKFIVIPSLFEGAGLPVLEAFREGAPVACSGVTTLPEYGGDGALYFDPTSARAIADALRRMNGDESLRDDLRRKGAERVKQFTWKKAALEYREIYRAVASRSENRS